MKRTEPCTVHSLEIAVGAVTLQGDLTVPWNARGLVIFAHGSGSSRNSARNRFVANVLRERHMATLLFDLLTVAEEQRDTVDAHLRFDIRLLADRLKEVTDWAAGYPRTKHLPLGYFGASTGAAAALLASIERRELVKAVVSRGGRPDLVHDILVRVSAPTLLIVGGRDTPVLEVNQEALAHLTGIRRLAVVPRATHLFEEAGALEQVARLAGDWFENHLAVEAPSATASAVLR